MKVLYVHGYPAGQKASFVQADLSIIEEISTVEELSLPELHARRGPLLSPTAWKAVARNDLIFGWFGECAPLVLIAKALRKPAVLVAGGADVASVESIGYGVGAMLPRRRRLMATAFRLADRVLLFSESSQDSLQTMLGKQARNLSTLYLGVDTDHFKPEGSKRPQALTISYITPSNLKRKGLLTFIAAARLSPDITYHLGGPPLDESALPSVANLDIPNYRYLGHLDEASLVREYQQAVAYVQVSLHEGFGMALAEAMACGCIPVVTRVGSIPEVAGDTGYYVPTGDPVATAEAVKAALSTPSPVDRERARQRICDLFRLEKRKKGLQSVLTSLYPPYATH